MSRRRACNLVLLLGLGSAACTQAVPDKVLVAHRGASAYAPEHTAAAYRLALEQGADFVEQDLQLTRDGALVCLHDATLERTTDVEEVFPDRFREIGGKRRWPVVDFDLEEVRRLDAGAWFSEEFAGQRVPTFEEAVRLVRGRAGLFPELKQPEEYRRRGHDLESTLKEALEEAGLWEPGADPRTPVYLQSFAAESLRRLRRDLDCRLKLFLLLESGDQQWSDPDALRAVAEFADGIGPDKTMLEKWPQLTAAAPALGLEIIPYTFSAARLDPRFAGLTAEMSHYLFELGVQGLFTDNPDLFPEGR